jgi:restriction endonuclease XhoI-like protein
MDQKAFEAAVRAYWIVREVQAAKQATGGRADASLRGAVTGGAHLDELVGVFAELFLAAGFAVDSVRRSVGLDLPGYYRPSKRWDLVVVERGALIAAIELKSHVGPSFGNNFNNRAEEAIGSATDVWHAYHRGAFGAVYAHGWDTSSSSNARWPQPGSSDLVTAPFASTRYSSRPPTWTAIGSFANASSGRGSTMRPAS